MAKLLTEEQYNELMARLERRAPPKLIEWNIAQAVECNHQADVLVAKAYDKRSSKHTRARYVREANILRDKAERHCECVNALRGINNG